MTDNNYYELRLRLGDIRDLFRAPELDPLSGQDQSQSGLDQLINELKPRSLGRKLRVCIQLPGEQLSADLARLTTSAVTRYCEGRSRELANDLASLRWRGIKALQTGLIFLAAALLLSTLFDSWTGLPDFLRQFLSEGFLIAGWVSLWHPTELLLYEWWPLWRDRQLYERLKQMELTLEARA